MTSSQNQEDEASPDTIGEVVIPKDAKETDGSPELLFRQITAFKWDPAQRIPGSLAFYPEGSDKRKPSFSRSSITTAESSFEWHNENARSKALSTWACSVEAVHAAGASPVDDSATPLPEDHKRAPGHAFVDYRDMDKPTMRELGSRLLLDALERGQLHPVTAEE